MAKKVERSESPPAPEVAPAPQRAEDSRPKVSSQQLGDKVKLCLVNDHTRVPADAKEEVTIPAGTVVFEVTRHPAFIFEDLLSALNRGSNFVARSDSGKFQE